MPLFLQKPEYRDLFRAVRLNPEADTPRLALADQLDEFGGRTEQLFAQFVRWHASSRDRDLFGATYWVNTLRDERWYDHLMLDGTCDVAENGTIRTGDYRSRTPIEVEYTLRAGLLSGIKCSFEWLFPTYKRSSYARDHTTYLGEYPIESVRVTCPGVIYNLEYAPVFLEAHWPASVRNFLQINDHLQLELERSYPRRKDVDDAFDLVCLKKLRSLYSGD